MAKLLLILAMTFSLPAMSKDIILTKDNTIVMNAQFESKSTSEVAQKAYQLHTKLSKNEAINLVIDSGGGSIQAGLELITNLKALKRPVNTICIWCASMAFQTVQGLSGERIVLPFGTMMSHKARGQFGGEFPGQLNNRLNYYLRRIEMLDQITVNRTNGKHTLESYRNLYENEYWCDGSDCVSQGFADKVDTVSCDSSLSGKDRQEFSIPIKNRYTGELEVVKVAIIKAACPTISGILGVEFEIGGKKFNLPSLEKSPDYIKNFYNDMVNEIRTPRMYFEDLKK